MNIKTSSRALTAQSTPASLAAPRSPGTTIDLSSVEFVDPAALTAIAAAAERAVQDGQTVTFIPPRDVRCATYLSRMHLGRVLGDLGVTTGLRRVRERDLGDQLCELRRFDDERGIEVVAATVMNLLRGARRGEWAPDLYGPLFEIGVNAVQHSGQSGGYLALQTFPNRSQVAFAVSDCGRGLLASLTSDGGPDALVPDDSVAVHRAATKHVSALDQPGRGTGLSGVVELVGRHNGAVMLLSGDAYGWFENSHGRPRVAHANARFSGTLAYVRLAL